MISYEKLRNLMTERGISSKQLSEMAGIDEGTAGKFKKDAMVRLDVIIAVCAALGCKIDDILDY